MTSRWFLFLSLAILLFFAPLNSAQARVFVEDNNQAVELLKKGRYREGIELLKKSLAAVPYDQSIRQNLLQGYLAAGQSFLQQKRYPELTELMLEAQQFDDSQRDFWKMNGYALLRLKEYFAAETELQEARAMGDPDAQVLFLLGEIYYATDRMHEAFDVLESAQLHDPNNHAVVTMLEKVRRELAVEQGMAKEYGGHFVVTFDGDQNDDLGAEVLEVLEDAYNWAGSQLDHYPQERVTVILYSRQQFNQLTDSPEWSGGLYDGKIRLPVGGIDAVDDRVRGLLYHEYMHVVLRDIAGRNIPYWLNEGLAELAEAEFGEPNLDLLRQAREQQGLFRLQTLEGSFGHLTTMQAALAYQQSYSVVRFLRDDYGWQQLRDLLFSLRDGRPIERAFDAALGIYGLNYKRFEQLWREAG